MRKSRKKRTTSQANRFLKATTDTTKLAVTGLVGSGIIASTGATLRNLTGK